VISFIVPAHNEERYLDATLTAIRAAAEAAGQPFEVIVVDDASTDATADIARRRGASVVTINAHHIAASRNAGARASSGDVLIFVDADTTLPAATLAAALAALDRGAVGGGARVWLDAKAPGWARRLWVFVRFASSAGGLAAGCFMFVRRGAFEAAGEFDERLFFAEEIFLSRAMKKRGRFVILREPVISSSRKYDEISIWQFCRQIAPMMTGWSAFKRRHDWWYGRQRD